MESRRVTDNARVERSSDDALHVANAAPDEQPGDPATEGALLEDLERWPGPIDEPPPLFSALDR